MTELEIPKVNGSMYTVGSADNFTEDQIKYCHTLAQINSMLVSPIYVRVIAGDYAGSIAKFTAEGVTTEIVKRNFYWDDKIKLPSGDVVKRFGYSVTTCWSGRLSWDKKKNNPRFRLSHDSATVLLDYDGETILRKFDYKRESEWVANHEPCNDVDGNPLAVNDKVIYLNLRYGCGGKLSRGRIIGLKGDPRSKSVIVMIEEDTTKQRSECRYSEQQIIRV